MAFERAASKRFCIGVDVSTTGVKAVLVGEDGAVHAVAVSENLLSTPHPLWSEQAPRDWWHGTCTVIRQILATEGLAAEEIVAVGLTGQMHGLVLLDSAGDVIRPAILWNDQRTAEECDEIRQSMDRDVLIRITGNDALTGLTLPKLLWVAKHEPASYSRIAKILLPKDYVRYRLSGQYATDKADAAGTLMLDLRTRDWSEQVLDAFGVPRRWLPETHEGPSITGVVSQRGAAETGLREGTPIVAGSGDQAAQAIGVGAVSPGDVAVTIGTSGVVFCSTGEPLTDPEGRLQAFCHAVPGRWHLMGVMLSAAGSLRWFRDAIAPGAGFSELVDETDGLQPGADGLLFLPYLSGERMPYADPWIRGAFVGLTGRHTRAHMTRAVLEGVCFGLRDGLELLRDYCAAPIEQVLVSGGGARSATWRRILAETLAVNVTSVQSEEGAALGAALLAGVGGGIWPCVQAACSAAIRVADCIQPSREAMRRYEGLYRLYRDAYPACRPIAHGLSEFECNPGG